MDKKVFEVGKWKINHLREAEYLSSALIAELQKFLNKEWLPAVCRFPSENPKARWVGLDDFGIPSPIIRVEMSPLPGKVKNRIFSIGKRPGLLGTLAMVARQFPEHRKLITDGLSGYSFDGFIQIGNFVQDDKLVAEKILQLPYHNEIPQNTKGGHYWVRVDPHGGYAQEYLEKLDSISLVPVRSDGCNSEFMALGMAERLSEMSHYLPWGESFVVKPVQGTWGENVLIHHLDDSVKTRIAVKEEIHALIHKMGPEHLMFQPYIPDRAVIRDEESYHEIWRLYFVCNKGRYEFTGGMVHGSRLRKVCGIDNTYVIPIFTH